MPLPDLEWSLGFEFVARKTYTDQLDGISSYRVGTHETANIFDKDWYYYSGFTVGYTFYGVPFMGCHTQRGNN
jgi:hypothetical protein